MDDFFELLEQHFLQLNLEDASEIVFCADGGPGIWPRIDNLIDKLKIPEAKRILDDTHAKQNISMIPESITKALELSHKETEKLSGQIKEKLWNGDIDSISDIVRKRLSSKRKALKDSLKKLGKYFGDHCRFQYGAFKENGLPTGGGTVESAIRRVINLRAKGSGMFWKRDNAEKMIFLRSMVLAGKLNTAVFLTVFSTCQQSYGRVVCHTCLSYLF